MFLSKFEKDLHFLLAFFLAAPLYLSRRIRIRRRRNLKRGCICPRLCICSIWWCIDIVGYVEIDNVTHTWSELKIIVLILVVLRNCWIRAVRQNIIIYLLIYSYLFLFIFILFWLSYYVMFCFVLFTCLNASVSGCFIRHWSTPSSPKRLRTTDSSNLANSGRTKIALFDWAAYFLQYFMRNSILNSSA